MSINFDDLESRRASSPPPSPQRSPSCPTPSGGPRHYTFISVDDHLVEPPDMFEGRVPARFADRAPRVELDDDGHGVLALRRRAAVQGRAQRRGRPARGASAASSRPASTRCAAARGTSTPASTTWTSTASTPRSTSRRRSPGSPASASSSACPTPSSPSPWCAPPTTGTSRRGPGPYPDRIIPVQLPWLLDPEVAAAEIRRNAARGLPGRDLPRAARAPRPAVAAHRLLGSRSWPPAPRPARSCASTSARRRAPR